MKRTAILVLVLAGCHDASIEPRGDGGARDASVVDAHAADGHVEVDAYVPGDFEVHVSYAGGEAIEDGSALAVEFGCQGGAHVVLDVEAIGGGFGDGTIVEATLIDEGASDGPTQRLLMTRTPTGASFIYFMFVLEEFVSRAGYPLPMDATLRVTVTRDDGARVTIERAVRKVEGFVCSGGCTYDEVPGTATITALEPPGGAGCDPLDLAITFDYASEDGTRTAPGETMTERIAPDCMAPMGLAVDAEVPAMREELVPGSGTCSPYVHYLLLDRTLCAAVCPEP